MSYSKKLPNGMDVPSHSELYRDFHKVIHELTYEVTTELNIDLPSPKDCKDKERSPESLFYKMAKDKPELKILLEEKGWDIVIGFQKKKKIIDYKQVFQDQIFSYTLYLEYKSSEKEWGKQFDAYIRQIKKRLERDKIPPSCLNMPDDQPCPNCGHIGKRDIIQGSYKVDRKRYSTRSLECKICESRRQDFNQPYAVLVSFDPTLEAYKQAARMAGFHIVILSKDLLKKMNQ